MPEASNVYRKEIEKENVRPHPGSYEIIVLLNAINISSLWDEEKKHSGLM